MILVLVVYSALLTILLILLLISWSMRVRYLIFRLDSLVKDYVNQNGRVSVSSPESGKAVNAVGDDLKKQIFLSRFGNLQVLFNLLDLLIKSGKELASSAENFVGKMPGQNTPATTTMATIEQGMKVFTAVYKRVYRSLKEFRKIYKLNRTYLNPEEYILMFWILKFLNQIIKVLRMILFPVLILQQFLHKRSRLRFKP